MPWYGPSSYQPWIPALDDQYRRAGITALASPERNFKIIASAGLHDTFGVYAYRNQKYRAKKSAPGIAPSPSAPPAPEASADASAKS